MAKNYFYITLALVGICQSTRLVQQLAHSGQCNEKYLEVTLQSLLDLHPPSVRMVYGDRLDNLKMGLETLIGVLNTSSRDALGIELTRYILGLMVLERRLNRNVNATDKLTKRISALDQQLSHFELLSEPIISAIASMYIEIISPLGPRIQVTGTRAILQNGLIQAKVRAVLLAGIRSAVLWQQVGGGRLQLMFNRRRLLAEARQILSNC